MAMAVFVPVTRARPEWTDQKQLGGLWPSGETEELLELEAFSKFFYEVYEVEFAMHNGLIRKY